MADGNGVHLLVTPPRGTHQLALMQQVEALGCHVIAAAVSGDRTEAVHAFGLHPLVDSVTTARALVAGYIDKIAAVFAR